MSDRKDKQSARRVGQGDAFKTASEVAFLAKELKYEGFLHKYKLKGKFIVPALVPLMKSSTLVDESGTSSVTSENTGKTYSGSYSKTNYVTASIPFNIAMKFVKRTYLRRFSIDPRDTNLYFVIKIPKNTEFVLNFIGEDINKIRVVGINERGGVNDDAGTGITSLKGGK